MRGAHFLPMVPLIFLLSSASISPAQTVSSQKGLTTFRFNLQTTVTITYCTDDSGMPKDMPHVAVIKS